MGGGQEHLEARVYENMIESFRQVDGSEESLSGNGISHFLYC